jgi:predicted lipid-binding transport protein (Tim44 family)
MGFINFFMRRSMRRSLALLLALGIALAPALADARAGSTSSSAGSSMGSRGTRTYTAPPSTNTAPTTAAPMQRSLTPQTAPTAPFGAPAPARPGFFSGSPFMSGLMGGLIGAGIGGMLFGGGMFGGIHGFGGFLGFLFQIFLVVMVVRFLFRLFAGSRQPAMAGGPAMFTPNVAPGPMPMGGGQPAGVPITPADYQAFEQLLQGIQAAWSNHDIRAIAGMATPEMTSYFSEQLSDQVSQGVVNAVTDVKLEQGDLSEAWAENGREYATVAMRFSMLDVTRDTAGRVVGGDLAHRTMATEIWTFVRAPGGHWLLSAIQQAG